MDEPSLFISSAILPEVAEFIWVSGDSLFLIIKLGANDFAGLLNAENLILCPNLDSIRVSPSYNVNLCIFTGLK